jgi:hypothetical protein
VNRSQDEQVNVIVPREKLAVDAMAQKCAAIEDVIEIQPPERNIHPTQKTE